MNNTHIQKQNLQKKKRLGILMPIRRAQSDGVFDTSTTTIEKVKSSLYTLFFTQPKTRVQLPEFGSPIYELQFEQFDESQFKKLESDIISAVKRWVPEAKVTQVNVNQNKTNPNEFTIVIGFELVSNPSLTDKIVITLK